jgi:ribonuclease R
MKDSEQIKLTEKLFRFLESHPDQIYKSRELARHLRVSKKNYQFFKRLIKDLAMEGKLKRYKGNRYGKYQQPVSVEGVLHVKAKGYGFVIRDDGEDIFIGQRHIKTAMHGDQVRVLLKPQQKGQLPEGSVVAIIKHRKEPIVGTFQKYGSREFVVPDDLRISKDIVVQRENAKGAKKGEKVVVEVIRRGDLRRNPEGKVITILGRPGDKDLDILSIIHSMGLSVKFPGQVLKEVESLSSDFEESVFKGRLDLRDKLIFTIDPDDAKDFDDAVSLELTARGNMLLGVHIADVSSFVAPGSAIDREALRRGTSIYLVDRVIPMLPRHLSEELCSLKPDKERLTYSVIMELTPQGDLVDYQITESVIKSKYRLTYKEVQEIIDAFKKQHREESGVDELLKRVGDGQDSGQKNSKRDLRVTIYAMNLLSKCLKKKWEERGSIDFNAPEVEIVIDKQGRPTDIKVKERLDSHTLIEEFMILANRTVAEHIDRIRGKTGAKCSFIYRIHERPQGKKLEEFVSFVHALGYTFVPGKKVTPKKFQSLLKEAEGTSHRVLLEEIALRTMMKAVYSTRNAGHFGLALKHYTHFTSPIRRYPDLAVHRLLKAYAGEVPHTVALPVKLSRVCEISNEMEITAQEAERESVRAKKVAFMEERIGEVYNGIISGVTSFGIFVEIPQFLVEGLVRIGDLDDDFYIHDAKNFSLKGQRSGKVYRLGDPATIRVAKVLMEMRRIDFVLV